MSKQNQDLTSILEVAVKVEEQSVTLYTMAQKRVRHASSKKFLKELVKQELNHKKKLLDIIKDKKKLSELGANFNKIQDLKITDAMKTMDLSEDADYQSILIYAAKREKATSEYYNSMARGLGTDTKAGVLFLKLAKEELVHKNQLEKEYDDYILKEN